MSKAKVRRAAACQGEAGSAKRGGLPCLDVTEIGLPISWAHDLTGPLVLPLSISLGADVQLFAGSVQSCGWDEVADAVCWKRYD